jgi:predicted RNase H-like nuclease (RuvC/YqgF family)
MQSLINAQSTHQATILQQAESVTIRSQLRAELNAAIHQRDEGLALAAEHRRTIDLLQQDLRDLKIKLSRATQEKMKIEREYQSTQRLNLSQANNERMDADYYKRKSTELNNRVQSLQIALSEKDRQLTELRHETTTTATTGNNNRTGAGGKRSL